MKIAELTETLTLAASDQFPVSTEANATRRVSLTTLADAILAMQTAIGGMQTQYSTPTTGGSIAVLPVVAGTSVWLIITPAATLATLAIVLPGDGSTGGPIAADNQEVLIVTTQILTALTLSAAGKTLSGALTSMAASGTLRMKYNAVNNVWYRVSGS